jgi:aminoglycoside phosphotransferase
MSSTRARAPHHINIEGHDRFRVSQSSKHFYTQFCDTQTTTYLKALAHYIEIVRERNRCAWYQGYLTTLTQMVEGGVHKDSAHLIEDSRWARHVAQGNIHYVRNVHRRQTSVMSP